MALSYHVCLLSPRYSQAYPIPKAAIDKGAIPGFFKIRFQLGKAPASSMTRIFQARMKYFRLFSPEVTKKRDNFKDQGELEKSAGNDIAAYWHPINPVKKNRARISRLS